jgi:signal transduction histidine kinase
LMDISEAEAGTMQLKREPVEVARVLQETIDLYEDLAETRGVRLAMALPSAGLTVNADYPRLRQALANLVDNAVKYTPPGGEVTVSAEARNGAVAFVVRDTGPGIPEDQRARIWERLYRGDAGQKERGLGLGLSLVRAVVEAHGGRAEVESAPGKGSTFTLLFPSGTPVLP